LGRLAQGDRQDAGRQGVEGAGVAGLLGVIEPPNAADRMGGAKVVGLVQADPARDGVALAAAGHQSSSFQESDGSSGFRSWRTLGLSNRAPMRVASLKLSSCRNFSSGVNFISIDRPSRPRRNLACRFSAL